MYRDSGDCARSHGLWIFQQICLPHLTFFRFDSPRVIPLMPMDKATDTPTLQGRGETSRDGDELNQRVLATEQENADIARNPIEIELEQVSYCYTRADENWAD